MAVVLKYVDNFNTFLDKYSDPRVINWFLMPSPIYIITICISYVLIVKIFGPKFMEHRKPLQLKNVLIVYNLFQVVFNAWIFHMCLTGGWLDEYSLRCQPVDFSNSPKGIQMTHVSWWYFISKISDLLDTIFFVLRKKFNQVTTLHVIHHGLMPWSVWLGVRLMPGGHASFFGLLNTFVHVVMYFYYFLTALGPQVQKYLWWKKYLTTLQIVQFVLIMVHAFQLFFIDCDFPRAFAWYIGMHAVLFFFLFNNFYSKTYIKQELKIDSTQKNLNGHTKQKEVRDPAEYYKIADLSELNRRTKSR